MCDEYEYMGRPFAKENCYNFKQRWHWILLKKTTDKVFFLIQFKDNGLYPLSFVDYTYQGIFYSLQRRVRTDIKLRFKSF